MNALIAYAALSLGIGLGLAVGFVNDPEEMAGETRNMRILGFFVALGMGAVTWPFLMLWLAYKTVRKCLRGIFPPV